MTSKLKTDVLETVSGSGTIALTNQLSGMTSASMPSGSVLQVVTSIFDTNTASASTSYVSSGHSVTITPKSASSKILLSLQGGSPAQSTNRFLVTTFYKGSSQLDAGFVSKYGVNADNLVHQHSMLGEDTHGVTSAITYTVYFYAQNGNCQYCAPFSKQFLTATEIKQ
tara:strand:- start:22 stop:525 length:504 start_codon:yes stop_codon:yes gene_type:complete